MTKFKLQFSEEKIEKLSMDYKIHWDETMRDLQPVVCRRGSLTPEELVLVGAWLHMPDDDVEKLQSSLEEQRQEVTAVTGVALADGGDERELWEGLTELQGVGRGIASSVLHWFAPGCYPVATKPAFNACLVGDDGGKDFAFWCDYTKFCREIAKRRKITMRKLDRAMCEYGQ